MRITDHTERAEARLYNNKKRKPRECDRGRRSAGASPRGRRGHLVIVSMPNNPRLLKARGCGYTGAIPSGSSQSGHYGTEINERSVNNS
ncbi:hypothetical protein NHX12_011241 [Muraenolepis orangiensis]|uniref:Uncharacterized protein n=1 Tax=Muraenolepis orangiensis TaxID=630683 RepID=A0A9Q0DEV0_9TELE|nr:hypothetical protein NHX12_011241 [Muraenolepis orangiensis]